MTHRSLGITLLGLIAVVGHTQQSGGQPPDPAKPAVANVEQDDAIDPYGALRKRAVDLEKAWLDTVKDADKIIAGRYDENKCSTMIAPQIARKRTAFNDYFDAESRYVGKQAEDIEKMLGLVEKAGADNSGGAVDYKAEITKTQADMESIKADLAKYPIDDPAYKEPREQLQENLKLDQDTLNNLQEAQRKTEAAATQLLAANAIVKARRQNADEIKSNISSIQIKTLGTYAAEEETYKAKCAMSRKIQK